MIHYHGTPITPRAQLLNMGGKHFCVSFATPRDLKTCLEIGQSVMFDNGAFSAYTKGKAIDINKYYEWLEPMLKPPHWAVMPDVIGGSLEDQHRLLSQWPRETLGYDNCASVFHLNMPLKHLYFLCNAHEKVCIGSAGEYWQVGSDSWCKRMDEVFNFLVQKFHIMPWIHGLRMLSQMDKGYPLASADSTNVAQNFKIATKCANCMANRIDAEQPENQEVMLERIENAQRQERMFA
jgi:hypothetical protein